MIADHKRALIEIESDLNVVHASAGVLHLAFAEMAGRGKDSTALAKSLWFTAVNIEAACDRIRETLGDEEMEADAPCACHRGEARDDR